MNVIEELEIIYTEIDDSYASKEFEAHSKGYNIKENEFQNIRSINDHSYFLIAFTRLEDRIKTVTQNLIDSKLQNLNSWSYIRVWRIIKNRESRDRLSFLEYVELLTEKGQSDYNLIRDYYNDRNIVAHGNSLRSIDMATVFQDFKRLYNDLSF